MSTFTCGRCGGEIEMTEERAALMRSLPGGVSLTHDVCPDNEAVYYDYRVRISIDRMPAGDEDAEPLELARVGTTLTATSFPEMLVRLGDELAPQWEQVRAMAHTVEADADE